MNLQHLLSKLLIFSLCILFLGCKKEPSAISKLSLELGNLEKNQTSECKTLKYNVLVNNSKDRVITALIHFKAFEGDNFTKFVFEGQESFVLQPKQKKYLGNSPKGACNGNQKVFNLNEDGKVSSISYLRDFEYYDLEILSAYYSN